MQIKKITWHDISDIIFYDGDVFSFVASILIPFVSGLEKKYTILIRYDLQLTQYN